MGSGAHPLQSTVIHVPVSGVGAGWLILGWGERATPLLNLLFLLFLLTSHSTRAVRITLDEPGDRRCSVSDGLG